MKYKSLKKNGELREGCTESFCESAAKIRLQSLVKSAHAETTLKITPPAKILRISHIINSRALKNI
jgi:hypothetical protein